MKPFSCPEHTRLINAFLCFRQQRIVVNGVNLTGPPVVSGVPQGTVLGSLLFSLYIDDIPVGIAYQIRLFADDCVCYREIKTVEGTLKLQKDIDLLGSWKRKRPRTPLRVRYWKMIAFI